ncbi:hypothetical protein Hanom_Chr11g01018451 [Helianthus anomalus]
MSDKWQETNVKVLVLKFEDREAHLYQAAFPTFGGSIGVRPLRSGEPYWYERIKGNFLYPPAGVFANPPTATEGALLPQPRPLRGVTSAGKDIFFLSSEESIGSSQEELSSWSNIFTCVSRDLGIDPEERPKKATQKKIKKVTVDTCATSKRGGSSRAATTSQDKGTLRFRQSNLEDYVVASDSLEGLSRVGEKKKTSVAEEEHEEEAAAKLVRRKRSREEATAGAVQKNVSPVIGKQSSLRSLYKLSPGFRENPEKTKGVGLEKPKEPAAKKTKFIIKCPKTTEMGFEKVVEEPAGGVILEKEKQKEKETETDASIEYAPAQTKQVSTAAGGSAATVPEQTVHEDASTAAGGAGAWGSGGVAGAFAAGLEGACNQGSIPQAPIGPKDTLGDIYYKTYNEEARGDAPYQPIWGLKQKDTFVEFGACRDWYLGSFPPEKLASKWRVPMRGCIALTLLGRPTLVLPPIKSCASGAQWLRSMLIGRSTMSVC